MKKREKSVECINMKCKFIIIVLAHRFEIMMCNVIICKIIAKRKITICCKHVF